MLPLQSIAFVVTDTHYVDIELADGAAVRSRMTFQKFPSLTGAIPSSSPSIRNVVNADTVT